MNSFQITEKEKMFFVEHLNNIILEIREIEVNTKSNLISVTLESFLDQVRAEGTFDTSWYLDILRACCSSLNPNIPKHLNMLIMFSQICAEVREVYLEFNLINLIGEYLDKSDLIINDYNKILFQDILMNYYFNEVVVHIRNDAEFDLILYLRAKVQQLLITNHSAKAILFWLKNTNDIDNRILTKIESAIKQNTFI